jgi:phage regulator Rha-like protein
MMDKLVSLYQGKEARVSTFDIFSGFGYPEHRSFKRRIKDHESSFLKYGDLLEAQNCALNRKRGGQEKSYLLNEQQFLLLVTIAKTTPESIELKMRIVEEFTRMRKALAQVIANRKNEDWLDARKNGKQVYFQKTDVIKKFVDYATDQGSKSASMYYQNIAKMENKALFIFEQKYPNLREMLSIRQLFQVVTADQIIEKALQDGMEQNLNYKDIYQLAKDRVIQFSNIIGKSLVIEFQEKLTSK